MESNTPSPPQDNGVSAAYKTYLAIELVLLFFGLPTVFWYNFAGVSPLFIIGAAFLCMLAYLYFFKGFPNGNFFRLRGTKKELLRVLIIFACLAPPLVAYLLLFHPDLFLSFAKTKPKLYILVMFLYPLVSVYPQEVIYRAFIFTRYKPLFGSGVAMVLCSAGAFGYAHIIFQNYLAVILTGVGGVLFSITYLRSKSLFVTSLEHALYGCFIFTLGLGQFFYHGAVQP